MDCDPALMKIKRRHARTMAIYIKENGFRKIAEIGVYKGKFMNGVLSYCPSITEYWGIDPWVGWDDIYLTVCRAMLTDDRIHLLRSDSERSVGLFPDGYFDLVFIDADHSYESVLKDLELWTPKVRQGGWVSGHDCISRTPGVQRALDAFFGSGWEQLHATCWKHDK